MNLRQLRYISAVAKNGLNISATAESLFTSQPGISKQIRQLEDELGVQIFERSGRQLTRVTPAGLAIIELADRALVEVDALRSAAREASDPQSGTLAIATTQTQARYPMVPTVEAFARRYPRVSVHVHEGTPIQIAELVSTGKVDFAIATEGMEHFEDLVMLPCYHWQRAVVVPRGHPLTGVERLTLEALAQHPIVTYVFGFTGRSILDRAFARAGITPEVRFTATDADIIKTYVRRGLGAGIVARMARDPRIDDDLEFLDASHLFERSTTKVGLRRGAFLRRYIFDFIGSFAPHLTPEVVERALASRAGTQSEALIDEGALPTI